MIYRRICIAYWEMKIWEWMWFGVAVLGGDIGKMEDRNRQDRAVIEERGKADSHYIKMIPHTGSIYSAKHKDWYSFPNITLQGQRPQESEAIVWCIAG